MRLEIGGGGEEDVQGGGLWETAEPGVGGQVEVDCRDLAAPHQAATIGFDPLFDAWQHFDAFPSVLELYESDYVPDRRRT